MTRGVGLLALLAATCLSYSALATDAQAPPGDSCDFEGIAGGPLTLPRAIDVALCRNAEVRSAGAAVRIRAAELGAARSGYWPSLNSTVSEVRENTRYPGSASPATTDTA